jgi:hypothetical protein
VTVSDTAALVRILFLGLAALGVAGIIVIWFFRRRMLGPEAMAPWKNARPVPLTPIEIRVLEQWQRRMRWVALGTLFYLGVMVGFASSVPPEARVARWVALLILPAMVVGGIVLQFSARCPRCGIRLGLQSSLAVPAACERCNVNLHPPQKSPPSGPPRT